MEAMIAALAERLRERGVPMLADPKRAPFRIYRDTRFSKDRSPHHDKVRTGTRCDESGRAKFGGG